jgi:hypothetical protein
MSHTLHAGDTVTIYHAAQLYTELARCEGSQSDREAAAALLRLSDRLEGEPDTAIVSEGLNPTGPRYF